MNMEIVTQNLSNITWENEALMMGIHDRSIRFNKFEHFAKFIQAMYPGVKTILEVGCGGGNLSKLLTSLGYKVTAIDYIKYNNLDKEGIEFHEQEFTLDSDISKYDLIIGLHCCEATEIIIRNCITNGKEFAVVVCEKHQGLENNTIKNRKQYINYLRNISNKLKITNLPIYEYLMNDRWGETIYYKKRTKVPYK